MLVAIGPRTKAALCAITPQRELKLEKASGLLTSPGPFPVLLKHVSLGAMLLTHPGMARLEDSRPAQSGACSPAPCPIRVRAANLGPRPEARPQASTFGPARRSQAQRRTPLRVPGT